MCYGDVGVISILGLKRETYQRGEQGSNDSDSTILSVGLFHRSDLLPGNKVGNFCCSVYTHNYPQPFVSTIDPLCTR